jgi:hypothetical protein
VQLLERSHVFALAHEVVCRLREAAAVGGRLVLEHLAALWIGHVQAVEILIGVDQKCLDIGQALSPHLVATDVDLAERSAAERVRWPPAPEEPAVIEDDELLAAARDELRHTEADAHAVTLLGDCRRGTCRGVDAHDGRAGDGVRGVVRAEHEVMQRAGRLRGIERRRRDGDRAVEEIESFGDAGLLLGDRAFVDDARRLGTCEGRPRVAEERLSLCRIVGNEIRGAEHLVGLGLGVGERRLALGHL